MFNAGSLRTYGDGKLILSLSRAQIFGASSIEKHSNATVTAAKAAFVGDLTLVGRFNDLDLQGAHFRSKFQMTEATVSRSISLAGAYFTNHLKFDGSVDIRGSLGLSKLTAQRGLDISGSEVASGVDLSKAKIKGDLILFEVQTPKLTLSGASAGNAKLDNGMGTVDAREFECGTLRIMGGTYVEIVLDSMKSAGFVEIDTVTTSGRLGLVQAAIAGRLTVRESTIRQGVFAKSMDCGGGASFRSTEIGHTNSFRNAKFHGGLDFNARSDRVPARREPAPDMGSVDFRSAYFGDLDGGATADFSGRTFQGKADFQHAQFDGIPYFERDAFKEDVSFRLAKFEVPRGPADESAKAPKEERKAAAKAAEHFRDERFHFAERAFSNLKDAMKASGGTRFERKFHVLELRCRRRRKDHEVGQSERVFSLLYDVFAEYGESIRKPLIWLFILPVVFAILYWLIGFDLDLFSIWPAFDFSMQQVFRPFFVWNPEYVINLPNQKNHAWAAEQLFKVYNPHLDFWGWAILIRVLATLQSIGILTLSFLLALSIKRRFQVS